MTYTYRTSGTCSTQIDLELEEGVIKSVAFTGGCNGNLQGISKLVAGMNAREAISKLRGIRCGNKATSCPDQLSLALAAALGEGRYGNRKKIRRSPITRALRIFRAIYYFRIKNSEVINMIQSV